MMLMFGKYCGYSIHDVPSPYLQWLLLVGLKSLKLHRAVVAELRRREAHVAEQSSAVR